MQDFQERLALMIETGFRNGMSFKQVHARVPALFAQRYNISTEEFHTLLEGVEIADGFVGLVNSIVRRFGPAEQQRIARRK